MVELSTNDLVNRWLKGVLPSAVVGGGSITQAAGLPVGAVFVSNSSANVANAAAVATLPAGGATVRTYITGFTVTGSGATAGLPVTVTLANITGGTMNFTYTFVAGVLVPNTPLVVTFPTPIPASALNTTIVVTCPASGAGGTNNTANATGFQLAS